MKKGKEKRRKITLKKGEEALKMHLLLLCWGENESKKREGGNDQNAQYISLIFICNRVHYLDLLYCL